MNKLDRVAGKAIAGDQMPIDGYEKCLEAYFFISDYCEEHNLKVPPSTGSPGAVDAYRELFGKISARCSFADFWRWLNREPDVIDHILPHRDGSLIFMEEYLDEKD